MKIDNKELSPNIAAKKLWQEQLEVGLTNILSQEFSLEQSEEWDKLSLSEQKAICNMVEKQYLRLRKLIKVLD